MKNLTTFSILLLCLSSFLSCVKESDMITENEPEVIHQEGETRLLTGIVKDTAGMILPQASVKVILGDLELETQADDDGAWNLRVPNSLTEGYIVANKIAYSKSIQRITETEDNQVEDIYLAPEQSSTELDLFFDPGNLRIVLGRILDDNANPIPGVLLFLFSV